MASNNENEFLDQWRESFEQEALQPPDDLWAKIEAELDKEEKKVIFFWWKNPILLSGMAASLLLVLGWFFITNQPTNEATPILATSKVEGTETKPNKHQSEQQQVAVGLRQNKKNTKSISNKPNKKTTSTPKIEENNGNLLAASKQKPSQENIASSGLPEAISGTVAIAITDVPLTEPRSNWSVEAIESIAFEPYSNRFTLNRKRLGVTIDFGKADAALDKKETLAWVGVHSGIAPFNPNFQSSGLQTLASAQAKDFISNGANYEVFQLAGTSSTTSGNVSTEEPPKSAFKASAPQPVQKFNNGRAMNIGVRYGKQLSKRVAFESGLRYLQGTSSVTTNVYSFDEQTGEISSFLANYLVPNQGLNNTIINSEQQLANNYEFLQVPFQFVYQLPFATKFQADIVAGLSTDILLSSKLGGEKNAAIFSSTNTSLYRTFNMSGLAGARLNYIVSRNWQVSIGTNFQQSIFSTLKPNDANMATRPRIMGLTYGLNYRFR